MKLLELTGIKNSINRELHSIILSLISKNYKVLGYGAFGMVFDNPIKSNEVIKFWFNDEGYENFLDIVESSNSPHYIKIIKRGEFTINLKSNPITLKYVRLEKLKPFLESNRRTNIVDGIRIDILLIEIETAFNSKNKNKDIVQIVQKELGVTELSDNIKGFIKVCESLKKQMHITYDWDLHPGNVFLRNNTLVIADPYFTDLNSTFTKKTLSKEFLDYLDKQIEK